MSTDHQTVPQALAPLIEYLSDLGRRPAVDEMTHQLRQLELSVDDLADWVRFDDGGYARNLIYLGEGFEILAICWRSGQRSPIHAHAVSTCGVRVLAGIATETTFNVSPCGQVVAVSSRDLPAPEATASQDHDTHQISNLQPAGQNLITLHVYSPPLRSMEMFSITGEPVEIYHPRVFEFSHGGGI